MSVVIPARNEEERLPRLLGTLAEARRRFPGRVEVIVSDNASTDGTARIAGEQGCLVVSTPVRKIAAVRNAGACAASGDILVFVDADIQVHPDTLVLIDRAMTSGRYAGGATGVRLPRISVGLALTYAVLYPGIVILRMDTGPTFCLRSVFETIGGYDESFRYAEDVDFLMRLSRYGRRTGSRLVRLTKARAIADQRKFDEHGDWYYFRLMPPLLRWMATGREGTIPVCEECWYRDRSGVPPVQGS